ncbi:MAG: hypothetical protein ACPHO8_16940, partial [Mariniblastus sp.]
AMCLTPWEIAAGTVRPMWMAMESAMTRLQEMDDRRASQETTPATSLAQVSGHSNSLSNILIKILTELEKKNLNRH